MKRRGFLRSLAAVAVAALTPQRPLLEAVGKWQAVSLPPPRFIELIAYEAIGITIANTEGITRLQFKS